MDPLVIKQNLILDLQDLSEDTAALIEAHPAEELTGLTPTTADSLLRRFSGAQSQFQDLRHQALEHDLTRDGEVRPLLRLGTQQSSQLD